MPENLSNSTLFVPQAVDDDPATQVFYLEVVAGGINMFQALIETYEGLAIVRTVDVQRSIVAVICPTDQVQDTAALLDSFKEQFRLRQLPGSVTTQH